MSSSVESLWAPEGQFCAWLSSSFLLMTVSLLFYHMTRVSSLEMNPRIAGFFSVALILAAVVITIMALYTYSIRLTELEQTQQADLTPAEQKEKQFKMVYFLVGIVIIVIELSLCMVIILGAFHFKIS